MDSTSIRLLIQEMLLTEKSLADIMTVARPPLDSIADSPILYSPHSKVVAGHRRELKRLWNQHADHKFFQNPKKFMVIHMLGLYSGKRRLWDYFTDPVPGRTPGIDIPNRNELSCLGFSQPFDPVANINPPFFTFKKYRVTFASRDDSATEWTSKATPEDIEFYAGSGLPKRPTAYLPPRSVSLSKGEGIRGKFEEVVIDNWIVDTLYCEEKDAETASELGLKFEVVR